MKPTGPDSGLNLRVLVVRGHRVVLDSDLAALYGVQTKRLNEAVRRHAGRFPSDFCFPLASAEAAALRSQFATSNRQGPGQESIAADCTRSATSSSGRRGGRRSLPWAFTEHGALMAATVLNSPRAVQMSLFVVRAFVRMREELATGAVILRRLAEIDRKLLVHDVVLRDIYQKLRPLLRPPPRSRRKEIGFHTGLQKP